MSEETNGSEDGSFSVGSPRRNLDRPTLIEGDTLSVAGPWEEVEFSRKAFGSDAVPGIAAKFESGSERIEVLPVTFQRSGRKEHIQGVTADIGMEEFSPEIEARPDSGPRTAFAVYVSYNTFSSWESVFLTIAADPDDALVIACWLTNAESAESTGGLEEIINIHQGKDDPGMDTDSDEDRIDRSFTDEPGRCLLSGSPTQSHEVRIPFRFGPLLDGFPTTYQGTPAIPYTVAGLRVAMSHTTWTENDLNADSYRSQLERIDSGEYRINQDIAETVRDFPAEEASLERFGNP